MKTVSLLISIIVGLCSVVLFREPLLDLVRHSKSYILNTNGTATQDTHLHATDMSVARAIRKVFLAVEQAEGAGARVRRSIGTPQLKNFSPFLMLDHFSIKPGAGFPDQ